MRSSCERRRALAHDDALGLGVVPQQIALVVGQLAYSALFPQPGKNNPALGRVISWMAALVSRSRLRDLTAV